MSDPLSDAIITVEDNFGNDERFYETEPGLYESMGLQVKGVAGRSYTLEIETFGRTYRSEPEVIPASVADDSIYYEFDVAEEINKYGNPVEFEIIRITRETTVPATDDPLFIKWELQETYKFSQYDYPDPSNMPPPSCYVTRYPDPQAIFLYNGRELKGGPLDSQIVLEREVDGTFYQRHYFNLIQYSFTQQAYNYWQEVDQIINQSGTIFDVPPANTTSNIRNVNDPTETVLGYFYAAVVDTSRIYTTEADLPIHIGNPCRFPNSADCERGCSIYDNAEPDPPYYWLDDQGR